MESELLILTEYKSRNADQYSTIYIREVWGNNYRWHSIGYLSSLHPFRENSQQDIMCDHILEDLKISYSDQF